MATSRPSSAKTLMVLGLLQSGPRHGYELHQIVVAHGSLYEDFKKPTLYHLLHRLTVQGAVRVNTEAGARGRRGERLVFELTAKGREEFRDLLRTALSSYEPVQTTFQMAAAYLPWLPADEAQVLLGKRRAVIDALRAETVGELDHLTVEPPSQRLAARSLAADHALTLFDAEIAWLDRAMQHLANPGAQSKLLLRPVPPLRRAAGK